MFIFVLNGTVWLDGIKNARLSLINQAIEFNQIDLLMAFDGIVLSTSK